MTKVFNRQEQKEKRQALRRERTKAEVLLWQRLRAGQIGGWKFRQQYSVGFYVLDFYCETARLCVEVDGFSHGTEDRPERDARREHSRS